jgi:hypothetical protein
MNRFLDAIEHSIESKNWYAAVALALTIPDICGWLEDPGKSSKQRYMEWFNNYLLPKYKNDSRGPNFAFLTGGDCYALRCAFLHEGGDDISRQKANEVLSRITFSTTDSHLIRVNDEVLLLNVSKFCKEVCDAVRSWITDMGIRQEIQERMKELISVKIEPFILYPGVKVS